MAAFVLAAGLWLWPSAWHVDEPFFLALARQILRDPLHPFAFTFNWYGASAPMATLNNTPPVLPYLLAAALKVSGGRESVTRALFLPFDLAAAWSLLALARRFLKKPLWPVLLILSAPGWALNMPHLMAERVMTPFALGAVWLAVKGFDEDDARSLSLSALLAALALLTKYNAVFVVPVVAAYGLFRGAPIRRLGLWSAAALSALPLSWLLNRAFGAYAASSAWTVLSQAAALASPSHRLRALLAFSGGLCLPAALWGPVLRPRWRAAAVCAAVAAVLYAPFLDLAPLVRPADRATGFLLSTGLLVALWALARGPRSRGTVLWASWLAAVAVLQLAYWSVMARFVVFLTPPLVFWLWERLEAERPHLLARLAPATFALTLALTGALGTVDLAYAGAQKELARGVFTDWGLGRRVWFAGHWGLQEYLTAGGGKPLDASRGGWSEAESGDLVVVPTTNANLVLPKDPVSAETRAVAVPGAVPLRLISARSGEAGFYSAVTGFLPWSFSREPLDSFALVRLR